MTTTVTERTGLTQADCWKLLRTADVGRVCYTEAAMPLIRPVPFVVDGADVVLAMRRSIIRWDLFVEPTIVAFEAGEWARHRHEGWSVRFVGKAQVVPDQELSALAALGLSSWIDGEPALYVRITAELLEGHALGSARP